MIPQREGETTVLRCQRCGYTEGVTPQTSTEYTIRGVTPSEERTITTLHVSEAKRRAFRTTEEWEQEREEYREVLLELLQEELEGGEE